MLCQRKLGLVEKDYREVETSRVAEDLDRVEREVHVGVSEDGREKWRRDVSAQKSSPSLSYFDTTKEE